MTWHAKALTTSYVSRPGAGAKGQLEDESAFPFTTTSWYFLDGLDVMAPAATRVVVAFGDSITDGTASTLNGDDRWPNALSRRLHAAYGNRVSVVNAGIGGNRVLGPAEYSAAQPFAGGPSAGQRLERDVIGLSGVSAVIWLEGINDLGANATAEAIEGGMKEIVARLRAGIPNVRIIGATVISALGNTSASHGSEQEDPSVRRSTSSSANPAFRRGRRFRPGDRGSADRRYAAEFVPDSTIGGAGDKLHPNRAGYMAMAAAIDLKLLFPTAVTGNRLE